LDTLLSGTRPLYNSVGPDVVEYSPYLIRATSSACLAFSIADQPLTLLTIIMPKGSPRIRLGAIVTFVIALICCVALGTQVLHNDTYVKAGIATLRVGTVILLLL
jgi:hypothetical protein